MSRSFHYLQSIQLLVRIQWKKYMRKTLKEIYIPQIYGQKVIHKISYNS